MCVGGFIPTLQLQLTTGIFHQINQPIIPMTSNTDNPTKQEIIISCLLGTLLPFGFYMAIWGFGQIADKKAQDPNNLIQGCMYYYGYTKK